MDTAGWRVPTWPGYGVQYLWEHWEQGIPPLKEQLEIIIDMRRWTALKRAGEGQGEVIDVSIPTQLMPLQPYRPVETNDIYEVTRILRLGMSNCHQLCVQVGRSLPLPFRFLINKCTCKCVE